MFSIYKKEIASFFGNLTGYIVVGVFLVLTNLFLWVIPGEYNIPDAGYANVDGLFRIVPWLFLFLCPAVSMRVFAEEKQTGTWELLLTKPISKWQITLGKYFAALSLVLLALLPTVLNYFIVWYIAEPMGNVDSGAFWGSFIGLVFLAVIFVSVGVFASSITNNQVVSFILAALFSFLFFYGFDLLANFFEAGNTIQLVESLGMNAHYKSMSRGVIDSRDVLYFALLSFVFLMATQRNISKLK
ncbi:MAG: gliding motility-associated ABC transporter permease subunit GldF [Porphyromonadaceae bacterium CG2_30_38_12]|nr:MAG: gliding motility-associated ABC transporter permease subunit GldF [Porphyromonadaceae bacterium CG2_30_38_12]